MNSQLPGSSSAIRPLKFYNTMTRQSDEFKTLRPGHVGIYCCGPTVYNFQHIGNMRTYIFEDVLTRTLRTAGYEVQHVMNITDVGHLVSDQDEGEDKMMVAMRREKKRSSEIAAYYTDVFMHDCLSLGITRPNIVCKATEHIPEMIQLIERLLARGMAYQSGGNIYFEVDRLPDYGKLARLNLSALRAGARIAVDANKRGPFDFALWFTKSKFENQELLWDSPWGRGYPGWHIECSAMAMKYLGEEFDIHCGGIDHVPNHHTNEIAQSEGALGKSWVKIWMHGEFLVINSSKMAKSAGNFLKLDDIAEKGLDPMAYRLMCLGAHYRTQLNFTWEALESAAKALSNLKNGVLALKDSFSTPCSELSTKGLEYQEQFWGSIGNDLNTPQCLALLWQVLGNQSISAQERFALIEQIDASLGLGVTSWKNEQLRIPSEVQTLLDARIAARANKQWAESDRLRDEIKKLGFLVEDAKDSMKLKKI